MKFEIEGEDENFIWYKAPFPGGFGTIASKHLYFDIDTLSIKERSSIDKNGVTQVDETIV